MYVVHQISRDHDVIGVSQADEINNRRADKNRNGDHREVLRYGSKILGDRFLLRVKWRYLQRGTWYSQPPSIAASP